jgi:hypothetical protein
MAEAAADIMLAGYPSLTSCERRGDADDSREERENDEEPRRQVADREHRRTGGDTPFTAQTHLRLVRSYCIK